jgi:hypothetical protein
MRQTADKSRVELYRELLRGLLSGHPLGLLGGAIERQVLQTRLQLQ